MVEQSPKITLGEMRQSGVRGLLMYCSVFRCSHWIKLGTAECDRWLDDVRLSDLEPQFVCTACGKHGAEVRPDFQPEELVRGSGVAVTHNNRS